MSELEVQIEAEVPAKPKSSKRWIGLVIGCCLSAAAIYYVFKDVSFEALKAEFKNLQFINLIPILGIGVGLFALRAYRWRYLLPKSERSKASLRELFDAIVFGFAGTAVLPLRAGEFVRPVCLNRFSKVPFATGLASVFAERVFDLIVILAIGYIALSAVPDAPHFLHTTAKSLGLIAGLGFIGLVFCAFFGNWTLQIGTRVLQFVLPKRFADKLIHFLASAIHALQLLRNPRDLAVVTITSIILWIMNGVYFSLCLNLFNKDGSLLAGSLLTTTIAFAVAAPSSPGFIGTFQAGCVLALTNILHFAEEFSLAYGILVHIIQTITTLGLAGILLSLRGIKFSSFLKKEAPPSSPLN